MEVLVLNNSWQPIQIIDKFAAIAKVFRGRAKALDSDYVMHDWESWCVNFESAKRLSMNTITSTTLCVLIPKAIVLTEYKEYKRKKVNLNRRNLYKRDNNTCQYCGYKGDYNEFNIDHVIPTSKGGRTVWTNVVLSCISCNSKKGNHSLKEAGMKLVKKPFRPNWNHLYQDSLRKNYENWKDLLGSLYWNTTLEE